MRNPIFGARARLALGFGAAALSWGASARATTVEEIGENGSEQMGRGGAWVARASDPLAAFYNPAGLAGQPTKLTLQANINILKQCFTRVKAAGDGTTGDGPNGTTIPAGGSYPQVCNGAGPFPDPQIAFTYRATPRLGLGFAVVAPSAAGDSSWPSTVGGNPAPQRYLLLSASTLLLTPTIAAGWEPIDRLRIGLGLIWGVASVDFSNDSWAANVASAGAGLTGNDVKGEVKGKDLFIPGLTSGVIWSPTDQIDLAGWYKVIGDIKAKGDITTTYGKTGATSSTKTADGDCNEGAAYAGVCGANKVTTTIPIPMEAKIGFRFHQPRAGAEMAHVRDPMAQDIFDLEADLTWAHDSQFQNIAIAIPPGIPVAGTPGVLPTDASVPHNLKDVYGARFGGDYNVLPDRLALRAGINFETAAESAEYQNIDFAGQQRIGFAGGATYRVHLGRQSKALEFSVGLGHTIIASSTYTSNSTSGGGVHGLAGTPCIPGSTQTGSTCSNGSETFRTAWPVNLGTITNAFTQINLGASYRF
jgi:long-chain fatty acid transport protein